MKKSLSLLAALLFSGLAFAAAPENPSGLFIEGYAGEISRAPGEEVGIHVSTTAAKFEVEISRIGAKVESVWSKKDVPGREYAVPNNASGSGCGWPEALRVKIPKEWQSGYYKVTLRAADKGGRFVQSGDRKAESQCFFVVRSAAPGRDTRILLQLTTNTYNAYNAWGGSSLYAYNSYANLQGTRVSFHRPQRSQFNTWELPFVQWAEANGWKLDYAVNSDLEFHPELLAKYKLILSVGHDEYWSGPMRDNLEAFIAKGGNVAFFSGNTCCWQVRSEDDGHALTSWKQNYFQDPVFRTRDFKTLSTLWSHHLVARPENQLTGVGFLWGGFRKSHGQFLEEPAEYTVHRPDHWVFAGTGIKRGDVFGAKDTVVGYEADGCELEWRDGLPFPTHRDGTPESFTVLSTCPVRWQADDCEWYERWENGRTGAACMGIYTKPGGGTVFTAATTDWAHGLSGGDAVVVRVTKNVLERLSK